MIFNETKLHGAYVVELTPFKDDRGEFARGFCVEEFRKAGLISDFVQSNISTNPTKGTLRGMHFQTGKFAEVKLVRCTRGAIYDVIIDLRPHSETYREWIGIELTPESRRMLYVPVDFAHGFQTLSDDVEVTYMVSAPYEAKAASGVRYDDPAFGIRWPTAITKVSQADSAWPSVAPANMADLKPSARRVA
jgi:dTDP-4-dehydrorhamnose 3,5-epimerase